MVRLWISLTLYQLKTRISLRLLAGVTGISTSVLLCQQTEAIAQVSQLSLPQSSPELLAPASPTQSLPSTIQPTSAAPVNPTAPAPKPTQSKKSVDKRKQPVVEEFPPNPLEITQPDPLIPYDYKKRPLTAQEIRQLRAGANRLAVIGATKLEQGDRVAAFNAWNRELRFRRLAGPLTEEVLTLGRVGDAAWRDSDTTQLRWVTKRLDEILAKAQTEQAASKGQLANPDRLSELETLPPDLALDLQPTQPSKITENRTSSSQPQAPAPAPAAPTVTARQLLGSIDTNPLAVGGVNALVILGNLNKEVSLLDALGFAYQQVRLPQTAVKVYRQLLAEARRRKDDFKLEATLITLGQLHLAWFDYGSAVQPYEELLARSRSRRDPINFPLYLDRLAYIYEQAKQPAQAIPYQEQLITFHQTALGDATLIPALTLKIADNHRRLAQLDQAETTYQLAYKLAIPLLQFSNAAEALKKLADLYRANNRLDSALRMYTFLVDIEKQAYNTYGMMDAYDQMGQVHLLRKEYPEAIAAFQQALPLAQQLKFREDYFATRIQKASEPEK
ncbi:MAG: hypothetical protein DCF22_19795 [Leptolyngbya sp.]|nr:MAG: hypothetical protein DCF22_19795 [Leptolyngbya sp.]